MEKKNLFADHLGRHLEFLSSPSVMPIYAGSFREITSYAKQFLVYDTSYSTGGMVAGGGGGAGVGLPLEIVAFLAHSHPTTVKVK